MKKEINKDKAICERCGIVMNIPKSYAKLCYDCSSFYCECPDCGFTTDKKPTKENDTTEHDCEVGR